MRIKILNIFLFALATMSVQAQEVTDEWKLFNKHTGEVRSIIDVFKKNDTLYGRVIEIIDVEDRDNLCTECEGDNKNKKILGMILLKNFIKDGNEYVDGTITNPDDGKVYNSKIWLDEDNPNLLNVRGYIGFFYKTMTWERLEKENQ